MKPQTRSEFPAASEKVEIYLLWGARCSEEREEREERERERKKEEAPLAPIVGYIGGCDQEEGEIGCACRERLGAVNLEHGVTGDRRPRGCPRLLSLPPSLSLKQARAQVVVQELRFLRSSRTLLEICP